MSTLGRLQSVDLRRVWPSESSGFTPWLAQEQNLALLGTTIGIELELEGQERAVGPFRADILCKDTITNNWVLIENQIEPTDHCHLGQLLTYAAGLQAVTIVWVAAQIRDEHRAALDWLNEITDDRFNFFGLEIELWQIGDSPVAPKFNVVCKPNDWSKTIHESARGIASAEFTETEQLKLEYWTAFRTSMEEAKSFIRSQKPQAQNWASHALGRSYFNLIAWINTRDQWISASVVLMGALGKPRYRILLAERDALEKKLGEPLLWEELPEGKESRLTLRLDDTDPSNRADWPRQHAWLRQKLEALHKVFAPRIKMLPAADEENGGSGEPTS